MSTSYDGLIAASGLERSEARLLLAHAAGRDKTWLIAHGDELPDGLLTERVCELFRRRQAGEPVAYLLGEKEFFSHLFKVGPGVLIPRPETELLVQWGIEVLQAQTGQGPLRALDLGCGSGCIGLSLALEARRLGLGLASLTQSDLAEEALRFTRQNALALGVTQWAGFNYELLQGSWFDALPAGRRYGLILSNPPYIRSDDDHLTQGDLRHEPRHALASGSSGLDAIEEITRRASAFLEPGGHLLIEHGHDQAGAVAGAFRRHGFLCVEQRRDFASILRLTGAARA